MSVSSEYDMVCYATRQRHEWCTNDLFSNCCIMYARIYIAINSIKKGPEVVSGPGITYSPLAIPKYRSEETVIAIPHTRKHDIG